MVATSARRDKRRKVCYEVPETTAKGLDMASAYTGRLKAEIVDAALTEYLPRIAPDAVNLVATDRIRTPDGGPA